jgi:peroxiredoxin
MSNPLTGDYQAVIQVSVRQINGLLGTLHMRRIDPAASPTFAHTGTIRYGTEPAIFAKDKLQVSRWFTSPSIKALSIQSQTFEGGMTRQPPGVAAFYESVVGDWAKAAYEPVLATSPRGIAEVQLSTPTISMAPGATSEVTVEVRVRARLHPDPGSAPMPEWVHGDVRATYSIATVVVNGQRKLRVRPPTHDNQVQFDPFPGSGVSPAQTPKVAAEIRKALQKSFEPLDLDLPPDFMFDKFRALAGPGGSTAIALPIQINAVPPGPGGIGTITKHLLNYDETGLAISREFVETFTNPLIESIRSSIDRIPEQESFWGDYRFSAHDFYLIWKAGELEFIGTIEATTSGVFAPNKTFHFSQKLTIALDVAQQTLSVVPVGPPDVNPDLKSSFLSVRDSALKSASAGINAQFQNARTRLAAGLKRFDASATLRYTSIEVTPDGLILRGKINTSSRFDPIVHVKEIAGGTALSAVESWVPGGRIDTFEWTWVRSDFVIPWANPIESKTELHRFVFQKPADFAAGQRVCLRIDGTVISPDGLIEGAIGGDICRPAGYEKILVVPPWYLELYMPIWWPDPPFDAVMDEWIVGHVNMAGQPSDPFTPAANTLIHFTGARFERPLDELGELLGRFQSPERALSVVLVLPEGTLARMHRETLEARLGRGERLRPGSVQITEDFRGGWTKGFFTENPGGPGTFFMNARRELVWSHEGNLDPSRLAAAIEEFALPSAPVTSPMRLAFEAGEVLPDTVFEDDQGERTSLRRLRGQRVKLVFWKSWSTACIRELQQLRDQGDNETAILAINGGEGAHVLAAIREEHGLRFPLIQDFDQEIATLYNVSCWPTTVSINEEGVVDRVQFGRSHAHRETYQEVAHERPEN